MLNEKYIILDYSAELLYSFLLIIMLENVLNLSENYISNFNYAFYAHIKPKNVSEFFNPM